MTYKNARTATVGDPVIVMKNNHATLLGKLHSTVTGDPTHNATVAYAGPDGEYQHRVRTSDCYHASDALLAITDQIAAARTH